MHILIGLIGLVVATVIIIMWARGGLFACVFLSIPIGGGLLVFVLQVPSGGSPNAPIWALVCALLLAGIWAPRYFRQATADRQGS